MSLTIKTLPREIDLDAFEVDAIQNVIGVAEDLSMRGDEQATLALVWLRGLVEKPDGKVH